MEDNLKLENKHIFSVPQEWIDGSTSPDGSDKLYVPEDFKKVGWEYYWVRYEILGEPDIDNLIIKQNDDWSPVPDDREPSVMKRKGWESIPADEYPFLKINEEADKAPFVDKHLEWILDGNILNNDGKFPESICGKERTTPPKGFVCSGGLMLFERKVSVRTMIQNEIKRSSISRFLAKVKRGEK